MEGKVSAENTFGQVLICLRMSKLNYVIKETPYSAFVTIRKKFVKAFDVEIIEKENVAKPRLFNNEVTEQIKELENENSLLQQKNNTQYSEIGHLKFEIEELEVKKEALENEKRDLESKNENDFAEIKSLNYQIECATLNNSEIQKQMNKVSSENKGLKCKIEESNKLLGDKTDFVDILENTVRNKVSEIEMLRLEMINFCKNPLSCMYCDYETDEDGDMKDHIKSLHG